MEILRETCNPSPSIPIIHSFRHSSSLLSEILFTLGVSRWFLFESNILLFHVNVCVPWIQSSCFPCVSKTVNQVDLPILISLSQSIIVWVYFCYTHVQINLLRKKQIIILICFALISIIIDNELNSSFDLPSRRL